MAQPTSPKLDTHVINHYLDLLSQDIKIDGVLLFGSYAWGKPTKHSDVDLAIISSDFSKQNFWDRVGWLHQKRDKQARTLAMDLFGYTPEEFAHAETYSSVMAKAKKDGVWLRKPAKAVAV